jgi:hypothetical protein
MSRRPFRDADSWRRCRATITLKDKSTAQCGRGINWDYTGALSHLCTQHAEMIWRGKPVKRWGVEKSGSEA